MKKYNIYSLLLILLIIFIIFYLIICKTNNYKNTKYHKNNIYNNKNNKNNSNCNSNSNSNNNDDVYNIDSNSNSNDDVYNIDSNSNSNSDSDSNSNSNSNNDVYNMDSSITVYPKFNECYYDYKYYYPQLNIINNNREVILQELNSILNKDIWHSWIQGQLSVVPLYFFGKWSTKGLEVCPKTCEIIKNIKNIKTVAFSRLSKDSQIQPHIGWGDLANNILRCHYGLIVPPNNGCVCDNWVVMHQNDNWLVFDDSKMHSSFNHSNDDRYILIIDMERPTDVPKGTSKVAYKQEVLNFINSFYDKNDIIEIKNTIKL
jgi:hypothetical protein